MKQYFGYIDDKGYLALKNYSTEERYKELLDSCPPLFIPSFYAKNAREARKTILISLIKSIEFYGNGWSDFE